MSYEQAIGNLRDRAQDSLVTVEVYCGVEGEHCDECLTVFSGVLREFFASHALDKLNRRGWTYRQAEGSDDPRDFNNWVCLNCEQTP